MRRSNKWRPLRHLLLPAPAVRQSTALEISFYIILPSLSTRRGHHEDRRVAVSSVMSNDPKTKMARGHNVNTSSERGQQLYRTLHCEFAFAGPSAVHYAHVRCRKSTSPCSIAFVSYKNNQRERLG